MIIKTVILVVAYFLGNISPAIIIGKFHKIDIRKTGSGNAGTTNVLRSIGKKAAIITLLIDILKGVIAVLLAKFILQDDLYTALAGMAVTCGHIWPALYEFKGGKGIATALGVIFTVMPLTALCAMGVGLVFIILTRRISPGSIMGALSLPLFVFILDKGSMLLGVFYALITLYTHRSNIKRILKGEEPKLSFKKKESTPH